MSMVLFAKDIVETAFLTMAKETTILDAARQMKETRHGFALIGTTDHPEGIVTEWDILAKVVAEGKDPKKPLVADVMSTSLVTVKSDLGIAAVSNVMSERGIRRVLVVDGDKVVGYITSRTVLWHLNDYVDKVTAQISRLQAPWF